MNGWMKPDRPVLAWEHFRYWFVLLLMGTCVFPSFLSQWMFPVIHHSGSDVTTIAAFISTSCATMWMTVATGVMRKRSSVSKSEKEGKTKGPKLSAVCKMYLWDFSSFCRGSSYTYDCGSLLTVVYRLYKPTVTQMHSSPTYSCLIWASPLVFLVFV